MDETAEMPSLGARDELPLFPLVGWDIGSSPSRSAVFLRLLYLVGPDEDSNAPHIALLHCLSPGQARSLAAELLTAAQQSDDMLPTGI